MPEEVLKKSQSACKVLSSFECSRKGTKYFPFHRGRCCCAQTYLIMALVVSKTLSHCCQDPHMTTKRKSQCKLIKQPLLVLSSGNELLPIFFLGFSTMQCSTSPKNRAIKDPNYFLICCITSTNWPLADAKCLHEQIFRTSIYTPEIVWTRILVNTDDDFRWCSPFDEKTRMIVFPFLLMQVIIIRKE